MGLVPSLSAKKHKALQPPRLHPQRHAEGPLRRAAPHGAAPPRVADARDLPAGLGAEQAPEVDLREPSKSLRRFLRGDEARELPYTGVVQLCLRRELPYTGVVQLCLRRKLPVPGTKRGAILYLCGEY